MTKRILLTFSIFAVAGCAGSNPQDSFPHASTAGAHSVSASTHAAKSLEAGKSDGGVVARDSMNSSRDSIDDIESPTVTQTASTQAVAEPEPAIVCERVYPTGSIIPVKVCRDVAAAQRKTDRDQRIFDHVKRGSAIGGSNAAVCANFGNNCF